MYMKLIKRTYRFRLYPSNSQKDLIEKTLEDSGVRLYYEWIGGNSNPKRIMFDFGTRIYKLTKI